MFPILSEFSHLLTVISQFAIVGGAFCSVPKGYREQYAVFFNKNVVKRHDRHPLENLQLATEVGAPGFSLRVLFFADCSLSPCILC